MKRNTVRWLYIAGLVVLFTGISPVAVAGEEANADAQGRTMAVESGASTARWFVPLGAGLAIGLAALGTGIAQAHIGAAGMGAIAENPKAIGIVILCIAIPETMVILGFVVAYLLISS